MNDQHVRLLKKRIRRINYPIWGNDVKKRQMPNNLKDINILSHLHKNQDDICIPITYPAPRRVNSRRAFEFKICHREKGSTMLIKWGRVAFHKYLKTIKNSTIYDIKAICVCGKQFIAKHGLFDMDWDHKSYDKLIIQSIKYDEIIACSTECSGEIGTALKRLEIEKPELMLNAESYKRQKEKLIEVCGSAGFQSAWETKRNMLFDSKMESKLFSDLQEKFPGFNIAPQVAFSALISGNTTENITDVIKKALGTTNTSEIRTIKKYLSKSRVDFVVFNSTGNIICVVECNGSTHLRRTVVDKDVLKAKILRYLGIELIVYGHAGHLVQVT